MAMTAEKDPEGQESAEHRKRTIGERVREHLLAAEVAAEEAAGYGWATEAVEAAEAAADPEHELGGEDEAPPEPPKDPDSAA